MIIPTRNRSALLELSLGTALWQRDVELEVIVVDDGSADATPNVLRNVTDGRVRVLRNQEAQGVSSARNRGIHEGRGEWVAFLDDDDVWGPNKLASQVQAAQRAGCMWVYTGAVKIDMYERPIGGAPPPPPEVIVASLPRWNLVPGGCSGVVVLRTELMAAGGFDPELVNLADWDLWIRLGLRGEPTWVREPLVGYRQHRGQASLDVDLILREANMLDRRYGRQLDRGALHHYLAFKALSAGNRRRAFGHFTRAAVNGQPRRVINDISRLVQARMVRAVGRSASTQPETAEWYSLAETWLAEVSPRRPRSDRPPG